jgi:hypothetical protein
MIKVQIFYKEKKNKKVCNWVADGMFQFLVALGRMFGGFERNSLCEGILHTFQLENMQVFTTFIRNGITT